MKRLACLITLLTLVAIPALARAGACVEIDPSRDSLEDREQRSAVVLLSSLLEEKGIAIGDGNCDSIYRLHHIFFGESVTVVLNGPQGSRQATVNRLEEVPALYSQLVNSLVDRVPMSDSNSTVTRRNVTTNLSHRKRVEADKVWFVRLGMGAGAHEESTPGAAYGFGFRYELDSIGVELSFLDFVQLSDDVSHGWSGSFVKIMGLYYTDPTANASPYFGGGIGWGGQSYYVDGRDYQGQGVQLELRAGYEMLRASTIRLFLQADAGLPLYDADHMSWEWDPASTRSTQIEDSNWTPTLTFSLGVGFGGGNRHPDRRGGFRPVRVGH